MAAAVNSPRFSPLLSGAVLVAATLAAYANTFAVPFVFDDVAAITQNPSLAHFSTALFPPDGLSVSGRPLANLSFALNRALGGEAVGGYHAVNLALHLANVLLLFSLVRRTVRSPHRTAIAFTTALLWALHPLHTASVTYVMQRTELLVSLAVLGTLSAFARATTPAPGSGANRWLTLSVIACLLGMASKEVMVSAPLLVLGYDRTFVAGSFRAALRQRPRYYLALAATWLVLAGLVFGTENRGASAGFASALPWPDYARTQLYAVPHYLRLAVWPAPLVFDYGATVITSLALILPGALVLAALVTATLIALRRWPAAGFCGVWFFALLAPTSSLVPIATQTIAEHRIYLALAAPLTLLAVALHRGRPRRVLFATVPLALALGALTFGRNADYRTLLALWQDTAAQAYSEVASKKEKRDYITRENIGEIMLAQVPGVSPKVATAILAKYGGSIYEFLGDLRRKIGEYESSSSSLDMVVSAPEPAPAPAPMNKNKLKLVSECFKDITTDGKRGIGKATIEKLCYFLS